VAGAPSSSDETVLCFDFGERRIGVAVGNALLGSARPLALIEEPVTDRRFACIARLIEEWQPQRLVVGRPGDGSTADDEPGLAASVARCERFARQLHGRFRLPVDFVDERWSTLEAQAGLAPGEPDDAEAAAIILRQYFDERTRA
jgi:putative Holliday junction resolvase